MHLRYSGPQLHCLTLWHNRIIVSRFSSEMSNTRFSCMNGWGSLWALEAEFILISMIDLIKAVACLDYTCKICHFPVLAVLVVSVSLS